MGKQNSEASKLSYYYVYAWNQVSRISNYTAKYSCKPFKLGHYLYLG